MGGELAPTIPRQRLHQPVRQAADAKSERSNDRVRFLVRQAHEHDVARLALDEGCDPQISHPFENDAIRLRSVMTRPTGIILP